MSSVDGKSNKNMYESLAMGAIVEGVDCELGEWIIHATLRWFAHEKNYYVLYTTAGLKEKLSGMKCQCRGLIEWMSGRELAGR